MSSTRSAISALALAAFGFGATFVVIKEALLEVSPMSFVGWRFLLGALVLAVLAPPRTASTWRDGILTGVLLFAGYALQTEGLAQTSASNSGLITGLYVVFTPAVAAAVNRVSIRPVVLGGSLVAFGGLALLTLGDGFSLATGDLLTVGCAIAFAGHIVALSRVAHRHRVIPLTAVQLLVTAILALAWAVAFGSLEFPVGAPLLAVVLTGLVVSAGAFLVQVWAQTVIGPNRTALVLALEPVFAAATAAIVLGERLTTRGWVGAVLILAAIVSVLTSVDSDDDPLPAAESVSPAH
ncbi:MAG: DMT family transporter [Acidimicrobiia bacterium]|nr:DMT family transporter [Acidimicrobiia bacterium]MBT8214678.1 DMT family transporter [Acidimicrobiia bacterium]NNF68775.1 DMT family transporter [Acidimicrobiia bacterium]